MYKAIIFDFFDVIHSEPFRRWLQKHGFERGAEFQKVAELFDSGRISDEEYFQMLGNLGGQSAENVKRFYEDKLIDAEMIRLIEKLRGRYKLGLLSNSSSTYLRPILEEHNLLPLFDKIIVSAEVGFIKPDPEIFRHALEELETKAEETVFIDDNPSNVAAAEAIGIRSIVFTGEPLLQEDLKKLNIL